MPDIVISAQVADRKAIHAQQLPRSITSDDYNNSLGSPADLPPHVAAAISVASQLAASERQPAIGPVRDVVQQPLDAAAFRRSLVQAEFTERLR